MPRPKQSVRGNLILLGVLLLPAALALLAFLVTGSEAVGWATLATATTLLLASLAGLLVAAHVSTTRPRSPRPLAWAIGALAFIGAGTLLFLPVILHR